MKQLYNTLCALTLLATAAQAEPSKDLCGTNLEHNYMYFIDDHEYGHLQGHFIRSDNQESLTLTNDLGSGTTYVVRNLEGMCELERAEVLTFDGTKFNVRRLVDRSSADFKEFETAYAETIAILKDAVSSSEQTTIPAHDAQPTPTPTVEVINEGLCSSEFVDMDGFVNSLGVKYTRSAEQDVLTLYSDTASSVFLVEKKNGGCVLETVTHTYDDGTTRTLERSTLGADSAEFTFARRAYAMLLDKLTIEPPQTEKLFEFFKDFFK